MFLTFEPIPDHESFRDMYEGMQYEKYPDWLEGIDEIIREELEGYDSNNVYIRDYDENKNMVCIVITSPIYDRITITSKVEKYLKKKFLKIDISVGADTYDM